MYWSGLLVMRIVSDRFRTFKVVGSGSETKENEKYMNTPYKNIQSVLFQYLILYIIVKPLLSGPQTPSIKRTKSWVPKLTSYISAFITNPYSADTSIKRTKTLK